MRTSLFHLSWTPEVEESWQTLFRFVIVFMKVGFRDRAKKEVDASESGGEKKKKQRSKKIKKREAGVDPPSGDQVLSM